MSTRQLMTRSFTESRILNLAVAAGLLLSGRTVLISGAEPAPSVAIRLSTIGFRPDSPKLAIIAGNGKEFSIHDARSGEEVLQGKLVPAAVSADDDPQLLLADLTSLQREGVFRLEIDGHDTGIEFRVAKDIFNWPFYCCVRALYLLRCGTEVTASFDGHTYSHRACHLDDAYLDHVGGPAEQRKDGTGGWHDAGDYNKYTVNGAFAVGMMLRAWHDFRPGLRQLDLDIPESGNDTPDFLDEVRWELDWLLKMQADDGRVYHKLSTLEFGGFILPEQEQKPRYVSPWSSAATADFVASLAQASGTFRDVDDKFANVCLAAAEKSYRFLKDHPGDHRPDLSAFSTGPYDSPDADDRLWAAAEMWEATGGPEYLRDVEQRISQLVEVPNKTSVDINWDWDDLDNLGLITYLLSERSGRDPNIVARVREDAIRAANAMVTSAQHHPYRRPLDAKHYWGCNGTVARQAINLQLAYRLTGEQRYRATMLQAIHHLFGQNPFGRSYVTGLGSRPPMFPHDRRSGGDDVAAPWPGYLVGGPWPTPTDWHDVEGDYRTNEVAINWNGALIYALAAFVEPESFEASVAAASRSPR